MHIVERTHESAWNFELSPEAVARWLARLWWASALVDVAIVALAVALPTSNFPIRRVAPLIAATALASAELAWRPSPSRTRQVVSVAALLLRVVLLTGLLELSGGPSNPFAVIYVAQVALALATVGRAWASVTGVSALVCYSVLISWHLEEAVPVHHRFVDFPTHLYAMWLSLLTLGELALHFAGAASRAIARREAQLEEMRTRAARTERLMALTTLAAGAAHELSTPLATIAVASHELEQALARLPVPSECTDDAHLIRSEVERCRLILDQMSGRAGGSAEELAAPVAIPALLSDLKARLPERLRDRLELTSEADLSPIIAPRAGLLQVLLSLIKNAFDASRDGQAVRLAIEQDRDLVRFVVRDEGSGMPFDVLRRAGEPFFTTKEAGHGFGLGLFLVRVFAERCGGTLALRSDRGTTATLTLPISSPVSGQ
ncbi:MAG: ATP-binding protein [Vicinamibacterales bacterium]